MPDSVIIFNAKIDSTANICMYIMAICGIRRENFGAQRRILRESDLDGHGGCLCETKLECEKFRESKSIGGERGPRVRAVGNAR